MSPQHKGLTIMGKHGPRWTGEVRFLPERLGEPLRWRKPRRVFVNSMSDLFHEGVSNEQIAAVFGVMAACPQHTFQVLTKRPERAREWFAWAEKLVAGYDLLRDGMPSALLTCAWEMCTSEAWEVELGDEWITPDAAIFGATWPLPNVWLGVSVEDQATADERIPLLLECPAAVRWVSYEPALGPVDFRYLQPKDPPVEIDALRGTHGVLRPHGGTNERLDWIVIGGESGPGARPFDLAWARSTIAQCREASVPCFVKQLGARPIDSALRDVWCNGEHHYTRAPNDLLVAEAERHPSYRVTPHDLSRLLRDRKGGDMNEWPGELRVREWAR